MNAYTEGWSLGQLRAQATDYDPRWDFADAAKRGEFAEFKRGFDEGFRAAREQLDLLEGA